MHKHENNNQYKNESLMIAAFKMLTFIIMNVNMNTSKMHTVYQIISIYSPGT